MGRTHSTYVNALATVAAFAEQMGCTKEARELLQEAEELHQEHEESLKSLPRSGSDSGSEVSEGHSEGSEEAEAEKIEQLTWEIQEFLKDGHPELAAKLLAEAEIGLLGGQDHEDETLLGLKKAALHTLWAAVLEDIGEKDRAAKLYDEALTCLKHQNDEDSDSVGTNVSDDASHESNPECKDLLELHQQQRPLPIAEKMKLLMERKAEVPGEHGGEVAENAEVKVAKGEKGEKGENREGCEPDARESETEQAEKTEQAQIQSREVNEVNEVKDVNEGTCEEMQKWQSIDVKNVKNGRDAKDMAKAEPPTASTSPATISAAPPPSKATIPVPKTPVATGSLTDRAVTPAKAPKKRPAPIAPKLSSNLQSSGPVRVGGGFRLPAPPKAPPKAKAPRKPKTKATPPATVQVPQLPETFEQVEIVQPEEETAQALLSRLTTSAQKAMVTADHFLGLSKFERAADILEEQLAEISSVSPLRNSDMHIKLLQKYGGILWWDGDAEGAIDAYAAADEVLTERAEAEKDPGLLLQRAKLWGKVAQVHRKNGDLEAADRHLEAAMYSLEQLRDHPSGSTSHPPVGLEELLKDLQASLGQICVEKKEYGRAQELYLMAFSTSESEIDRPA